MIPTRIQVEIFENGEFSYIPQWKGLFFWHRFYKPSRTGDDVLIKFDSEIDARTHLDTFLGSQIAGVHYIAHS